MPSALTLSCNFSALTPDAKCALYNACSASFLPATFFQQPVLVVRLRKVEKRSEVFARLQQARSMNSKSPFSRHRPQPSRVRKFPCLRPPCVPSAYRRGRGLPRAAPHMSLNPTPLAETPRSSSRFTISKSSVLRSAQARKGMLPVASSGFAPMAMSAFTSS